METVLAEASGGVARLVLNKPQKLNVLDEQMLGEMERSFDEWERNGDVTVVVVGAAGERAFCAGADIATLAKLTEATMRDWELLGNRVLDRIQNSPLISVASIPGHALGGGLTLAAACDFRIAADHSGLGQPEIDLGWVPGWGGVARLVRLIGHGRALDLSMTGRRITAREAESIGLLNRVVPVAELEAAVAAFAGNLSGRSREALRGIKALAAAASLPRGPEAHRFDALLNSSLLNDERGQAAIRRFLERKKS